MREGLQEGESNKRKVREGQIRREGECVATQREGRLVTAKKRILYPTTDSMPQLAHVQTQDKERRLHVCLMVVVMQAANEQRWKVVGELRMKYSNMLLLFVEIVQTACAQTKESTRIDGIACPRSAICCLLM